MTEMIKKYVSPYFLRMGVGFVQLMQKKGIYRQLYEAQFE